jgi:hypothetical protein
MVQPEATDGNIIRLVRFACWITKATDTIFLSKEFYEVIERYVKCPVNGYLSP